MPPPQSKCLPQIVWVRRFSHRIHRIHRNSCWGYSPTDFTDLHRLFGCVDSPTDFTEFTETLAGDILPQISQIYTDCLGAFKGVHLSPLGFAACQSKKCTNIARGAPTEQEVHQPSKKCTNVARLGVCQNSQAVRPEGAEAHSPGPLGFAACQSKNALGILYL